MKTRCKLQESIEKEPPQSLAVLYILFVKEIAQVEKELYTLEQEFYGGKTSLEYVKWYGTAITDIIDHYGISELSSMQQCDLIFALSWEREKLQPGKDKAFDNDKIKLLHEVQSHVRSYIPMKFIDPMQRINELVKWCARYMRTFYSLASAEPVEVAKQYTVDYNQYESDMKSAVQTNFAISTSLLSEGLSLARVTYDVVYLLQRANVMQVPLLAAFPQMCHNLHAALRMAKEWVEKDSQYVTFLRNDVETMKRATVQEEKQLQDIRHENNMRRYNTKQIQRRIAQLKPMIDDEDNWLVSLTKDVETCRADIQRRKGEHLVMVQDYETAKETNNKSEMTRLGVSLNHLKNDEPCLHRKVEAATLKIKKIKEHKAEYLKLLVDVKKQEATFLNKHQLCVDKEYKIKGLIAGVKKCTELVGLKSSPDTLKKIFYEMPIGYVTNVVTSPRGKVQTTTHSSELPLSGRRDKMDEDFSAFCDHVAQHIGRDWPKLYRALPFVPTRGTVTVDNDVLAIRRACVGDLAPEPAARALARWRRHHRRARPADVRLALAAIGRADDVLTPAEVTKTSRRGAAASDLLSTVPDTVDRQLVPFYRQVERFDALRAANKI